MIITQTMLDGMDEQQLKAWVALHPAGKDAYSCPEAQQRKMKADYAREELRHRREAARWWNRTVEYYGHGA